MKEKRLHTTQRSICLLRSARNFYLAFVVVLLLGACSAHRNKDSNLLDNIRGQVSGLPQETYTVSREKYRSALSRADINSRVRVIEIFKGTMGGEGQVPEYRLFGIDPLSAHYMIGLRNADVLVGLHGYIVKNANVLQQYLVALYQERESVIEVRRMGQPLQLKIKFES